MSCSNSLSISPENAAALEETVTRLHDAAHKSDGPVERLDQQNCARGRMTFKTEASFDPELLFNANAAHGG
jgi:hypothetical protein